MREAIMRGNEQFEVTIIKKAFNSKLPGTV